VEPSLDASSKREAHVRDRERRAIAMRTTAFPCPRRARTRCARTQTVHRAAIVAVAIPRSARRLRMRARMTELRTQTNGTHPTSTPEARIAEARRIADTIAGPAAIAVDRDSRFPHEAIDALKAARMLSAYVPRELGGFGASVSELFTMCEALGERCASAAMVFAMHQIQVACVVRHGTSDFFRSYARRIADEQRLIASVTSEAGVGGSVRTSISPIEREGGRCKLRKDGTVVSYGEAADDLLITVRRAPDAPMSDQAMVLVGRDECHLEKTGSWDTFGMRGTCSPGFVITASFDEDRIVPDPFADISAHTMLPWAHMLWSGVWLGIATDAVARARAFVRGVARQTPGQTPPSAKRLAEVGMKLQTMRAHARDLVRRYDEILARPDAREELSSIGFAITMNNLKLASSLGVVDIVTDAMRVCGTVAYRNDTQYSMTRHLRDAHSAALMIGNDRILATNGTLHLVHKDDALGLV
jgi:acyl-CoA dehydrogenase